MSNQKITQSIDAGATVNDYNINKFFEDYVLQKNIFHINLMVGRIKAFMD